MSDKLNTIINIAKWSPQSFVHCGYTSIAWDSHFNVNLMYAYPETVLSCCDRSNSTHINSSLARHDKVPHLHFQSTDSIHVINFLATGLTTLCSCFVSPEGNQVMTKSAHWWSWLCDLHGCLITTSFCDPNSVVHKPVAPIVCTNY